MTTGGRTFAGNPPALTLYDRNKAIWESALFLIGLVLVAGLADLFFRAGRRITGPGLLAMVAGGSGRSHSRIAHQSGFWPPASSLHNS